MSKHCKFLRKDGTQCRADVQIGQDICVFHDPLKVEDVRRGRRQGGIKRSRRVTLLSLGAPDQSLTTAAEISSLLADSINQLRRGQLDPGVANTIGYLATVQLGSLRQGRLEDHVSKLEDRMGLIARSPISNHLREKGQAEGRFRTASNACGERLSSRCGSAWSGSWRAWRMRNWNT